ncbi:methionine ABC transporter permease [Wielerella bovis]|uniref:methionine ABC transporter permease n=1 Tax=Wielerella bovis TaxID=2917790 RepID=UPI0020188B5F|nr:methionine ABC transporter permease [Wielerella bovis]MCG7657950.1 ABC transporter permease [Wielerella bovis]MCG7660172.1 ABC transporter permease [Wielerella bovis]ULJ60188.1 ABC transporter permease [Wielerella bovis]ULJ62396.1 ABC transporter permease [Wielerella bovis]ULJ64622.1 ABC transporter permease [Wielerella bovis]
MFDFEKWSWEHITNLLPEIYKALGETLIMLAVATPVSVFFGSLIGILLFISDNAQISANPVLNKILNVLVSWVRSFPFVILMIVLMPLTRIIAGTSFGPFAASVALSVAASFYFARLVEQNLKEVPRGVVEAAQAMGASPKTIIFKVLLSEARSGLVLSVTILMIAILGESAAAGLIGGGGIGDLGIRYGHQRYMPDVMALVVVILTVLVVIIQMTGNFLSAKLNKR